MRKLIACLITLLCLGGIALADGELSGLMTVYDLNYMKPRAVLLSGTPMETYSLGQDWTMVGYPNNDTGADSQQGRVKTAEMQSGDYTDLPQAVMLKDTYLETTRRALSYPDMLKKGDTVYVAGREFGAWYVVAEDGRLGAVPLDAVSMDASVRQALTDALPGAYADQEALNVALQALDALWDADIDEIAENLDLQPEEEQLSFSELMWRMGIDSALLWYAEPAPETGLTREQVIQLVQRYVQEELGIALETEDQFGAGYGLWSNQDQPVWSGFWHSHGVCVRFNVKGNDLETTRVTPNEYQLRAMQQAITGQVPDITVTLTADEIVDLLEHTNWVDWPIALRHAYALVLGWEDTEAQQIEPGMLTEREARARIWEAAEDHGIIQSEDATIYLMYYAAGTTPVYDWTPTSWSTNRPVFRGNIMLPDPEGGWMTLLEVWLDAETGEVYRASEDSSGNG